MKTRVLAIAAALIVSTIGAGRCLGQQCTTANIPFAFVVGNKTLPAGEYQIQQPLGTTESAQLIRRSDGSVTTIVLTMAAEPNDKNTQPRLIFKQYGHEYFLSQIWRSEGMGRKLFESPREKELAASGAPTELAVLLPAPSVQP